MLKRIIVIILLFLSVFISAQDEYDDLISDLSGDLTGYEDSATDKTKKRKFKSNLGLKLSILGDHIFEFHVPVIKDAMDYEGYIKSPKFKNDLGLEIYFKKVKLISHWQFDLVLNEWGDLSKFLEIKPLENYISWSPWKFNFSVGFLKYSWGTADGINPTDNLNLRDYRKPIDPRKISVFSIYTGFYPARFISIEAVYIPFYLNFVEDTSTALVESFFPDADVAVKDVKFKPEHFALGTKLSFFFRYIDFSFSYLTMINPYYSMEIELDKKTAGTNTYYALDSVTLINNRLHHIGADLKASVSIFGIWLELCYTITEDILMEYDDVRNHQLRWAAGFDFNYGPDSEFYFNFQYFGTYNPLYYYGLYNDYDNGQPELDKNKSYYEEYYFKIMTNELAGIREGMIHGVSINMKWPVLNSLLTPSIKIVYSLPLLYDTNREARYGSLYIKPELDIMPFETFNIVIGAELYFAWHMYEGNLHMYTADLVGSNHENSSIYFEVRYNWGLDVKR